ncbi:hypothetical protein ES332_A08G130000v1 [Gossypium tomentosum]|uniref:Uncharacterized protein n=1 Tax=Gossypium tomentosum TaxID=34277 RepID=A0A5D2PF71_GOSTO|nr:hypothetical protein ES332_A08G130000v1 [Gossypium tomentosum]
MYEASSFFHSSSHFLTTFSLSFILSSEASSVFQFFFPFPSNLPPLFHASILTNPLTNPISFVHLLRHLKSRSPLTPLLFASSAMLNFQNMSMIGENDDDLKKISSSTDASKEP